MSNSHRRAEQHARLRVLESILYVTPRADPALMLAPAFVLALATLLACLLPARCAVRPGPARTLTKP